METIADVWPAVDATDTELEKTVQSLLVANRGGYWRVSVRAIGGTVNLSGQVCSFFLRQLAVALTKQVTGVCEVVDELEVDREKIGTH